MKASDRGGEIGIYTPAELSVMLTGIEQKFLPACGTWRARRIANG